MFWPFKNPQPKPWPPRWRVVQDPHTNKYHVQSRRVRGGAKRPVFEYDTRFIPYDTAQEALDWIERENQRPIVVHTVD